MSFNVICIALVLIHVASLTAVSVNYCLSGWTYCSHTEHCYQVQHGQRNYSEAKQRCNRVGANLTSIHSEDENDFVSSLASAHDEHDPVITHQHLLKQTWIGLTQFERDSWQWDDGTDVDYENWTPMLDRPSEPSSNYCVMLFTDNNDQQLHYKWGQSDCQKKLRAFVCRKRPEHVYECKVTSQ